MNLGLDRIGRSIKDEVVKYGNAPEGDTTIADTETYVKSLHDYDGASDKFRYPCNKSLQTYFKTPKKLDVLNVISFFQGFCNFLDGVDAMLSEVKEFEADMKAEFEADMYADCF